MGDMHFQRELLETFIQLEGEEAEILEWLQLHQEELLSKKSLELLAEMSQSTINDDERQRIEDRTQLLLWAIQMKVFSALPTEEKLFVRFLSAQSSNDLRQLTLQIDEETFDLLRTYAKA